MAFIFHILFLFFVWGGWPSGITGNTYTWKILSSNPTDGLGQDGLWDPHYEAPGNLQIGHLECFADNFISPIFALSLKLQACYIMVQWGDFTAKNVIHLIKFSIEGGAWQHLKF